jgi:hypothetical protein
MVQGYPHCSRARHIGGTLRVKVRASAAANGSRMPLALHSSRADGGISPSCCERRCSIVAWRLAATILAAVVAAAVAVVVAASAAVVTSASAAAALRRRRVPLCPESCSGCCARAESARVQRAVAGLLPSSGSRAARSKGHPP